MFTVHARSVLQVLANRSLPQELSVSKQVRSQQREIASYKEQDRSPRFAHVVCTFAHVRTHFKLGSRNCLGCLCEGGAAVIVMVSCCTSSNTFKVVPHATRDCCCIHLDILVEPWPASHHMRAWLLDTIEN